ncbi:MAG: YHS domain-containing protein [Gemmataceae bacterium]
MRPVILSALILAASAPAAPAVSKKDALKPLHDLIGEWKGTGTPQAGTREEREKGFWVETVVWQWQFKGADAWLRADVAKGKHFTRLEIRPGAGKDEYGLKAWTADGKEQAFAGKLDGRRLLFDRDEGGLTHRLSFSLLHGNRHLYRYETRKSDTVTFTPRYQVGATKQGVPFAVVDKGPECVVSGGLGTSRVTYKGKTYYVCCSGCRDAFNEEPEKYVQEFEAARKKD